MRLFDSHAHLESKKFAQDRSQVVARAMSAGVAYIVTCASDLETSQTGIDLVLEHAAQTCDGLYAAVGIHPHQAVTVTRGDVATEGEWHLDDAALARLEEMVCGPRVVALGEIGLDYHYDFSPRDVQRAVFERQLCMAIKLGLPVIVHNRESDRDLCAVVDKVVSDLPHGLSKTSPPLRGVLHCFMADRQMAEWALSKGFYLGIGGPITFKNMRHLPDIVRDVPLNRLLVETDCPYLAPHPKRGRRNEPAFVVHVAQRLAEILGVSAQDIARHTTENACALFGVS